MNAIQSIVTLLTPFTSSLGIPAILIILCIFIYRFGRLSKDYEQTKKKVDTAEKSVHHLKSNLHNLDVKVSEIIGKLSIIGANTPITNQSPLGLTDIGKTIVKELSAEEIFDRIKSNLEELLDKENTDNPYDIQQASINIARNKISSLLTPEEIKKAKDLAFEKELTEGDIYSVFGILLRDYMFKKHKIRIEEIDTHDPNHPDNQ